MTDLLTPAELQALAKELGIRNPILSHRVSGGRVELFLLGGSVVSHELEQGKADHSRSTPTDPPRALLETLSLKDLRRLAAELEIPGRSKMKRTELVKAIRDAQGEDQLPFTA